MPQLQLANQSDLRSSKYMTFGSGKRKSLTLVSRKICPKKTETEESLRRRWLSPLRRRRASTLIAGARHASDDLG